MRWLGKRLESMEYPMLAHTTYWQKRFFEGIITKEEANGAVNGMVFAGWRYRIKTYTRIKALKPGKGRHLIYWLSSPF